MSKRFGRQQKRKMQALERKGMVKGQPGKGGQTAYFLTDDGRKALRGL